MTVIGSASHAKQGIRFVTGIGSASCDITRNKGYDFLRALGSACRDITHETGGTTCYGNWVLYPLITPTKQWELRFVTGIGLFIL